MNELVLLKSPLIYVVLLCIAALHVFAAILTTLKRERLAVSPTLLALIAESIVVVLHVVTVVWGLFSGATADEILLTLLFSGAFGIVAIGIAEKKRKSDES